MSAILTYTNFRRLIAGINLAFWSLNTYVGYSLTFEGTAATSGREMYSPGLIATFFVFLVLAGLNLTSRYVGNGLFYGTLAMIAFKDYFIAKEAAAALPPDPTAVILIAITFVCCTVSALCIWHPEKWPPSK
ncbi:MAG: hypothetical protein COY40_06130 [Alphaproteobacteria bacterium CG_4_10_14_0_8_um_filter_53_9]|nr:MAG: hypothetical protein COY40_06130 [Alphaproteobacteria bacterium CG_4_10_14_0_8_um_filter_53_9]